MKYIFPYKQVEKDSKIIIYGAGGVCRDYLTQIQQLDYCQCIFVVDKNYANIDNICGVPVLSPDSIAKHEYDKIVIASEKDTDQIYYYLLKILVNDTHTEREREAGSKIVKGCVISKLHPEKTKFWYKYWNEYYSVVQEEAIKKALGEKPVLRYLNVQAAEHCNMRCNACCVFSPLVKEAVFPSLEQLEKDMARLSELFSNIRRVVITGGEPFLNKELHKFIYQIRFVFPKANIAIVTNGLLYKKLQGELLQAVLSTDSLIQVSVYKPMIDKIDNMRQFFIEKGVQYRFTDLAMQFMKFINISGDSDPEKVITECGRMSRCTFLDNGRIARCPIPSRIKHFNKYFGQSLNMEHDLIDIHDSKLDGFELKRRLVKPMDSCRYCSKMELVDWSQISKKAMISDFCTTEQ